MSYDRREKACPLCCGRMEFWQRKGDLDFWYCVECLQKTATRVPSVERDLQAWEAWRHRQDRQREAAH